MDLDLDLKSGISHDEMESCGWNGLEPHWPPDDYNFEAAECTLLNGAPDEAPSDSAVELAASETTHSIPTSGSDSWDVQDSAEPEASSGSCDPSRHLISSPHDLTNVGLYNTALHCTSAEMMSEAGTQPIDLGRIPSEICDPADVSLAIPAEPEKEGQDALGDGECGADHNVHGETATKYDFRPHSRSCKPSFNSTWIDQDETGDYDPSASARRPPVRRSRLRAPVHFGSTPENTDEDGVQRGEKIRQELVVTFRFTQPTGTTSLKRILDTQLAAANANARHNDSGTGYHLRTSSSRPVRTLHPIAQTKHRAKIAADLTGHPSARGCWECLELDLRCPLLDDESAWPCLACREDEHDCDLVMPPLIKRACERCKSRRWACSYSSESDHSAACQECAADGYRCVAGPANEGIVPRIRYVKDGDENWPRPKIMPVKSQKPGKPRTYWTCMQCKEAGRVCSLSTNMTDDCTACEMSGSICIPEQVNTTSPQRGRVAASANSDSPRKRKPLADGHATPVTLRKKAKAMPEKSSPTVGGTEKTLTTKFCHPIAFNYDGQQACNFCDGSSYPLLGLGPKKAEVIDWADGRGLTEISNGHQADGAESTRMCTACMMQRCSITTCQQHKLSGLLGVLVEKLDFDAALTALFAGTPRAQDRFCALCPNLATHRCTTLQEMDEDGEQAAGCGLLLCEACSLCLDSEFQGNLQTMLARMEDGISEERPLGLRADWSLLDQKGLLMRYVVWSSRQ